MAGCEKFHLKLEVTNCDFKLGWRKFDLLGNIKFPGS